MKRAAFIFSCLAFCACDERKPQPQETVQGAESAPAPSSPRPDGAEKEPLRTTLTAAEFHSELATKNLSPELPRVPPVVATMPDAGAKAQLQFTRIEGGNSTYCGTLSAGPIQCWGKESRLFRGRYTDLALGDSGYCGVDLSGQLTCDQLTPPQGKYVSVVASGGNYCALGKGGGVACFGPDAVPPFSAQRAEFLAVGHHFGCAADPTRRLTCWGDDAPLLPIDPIVVKEIAAGDTFVCALEEDGSSRCFGKGPRLPDGKYSAINAGFSTLCGVTREGVGICTGGVEHRVGGSVRRFAIAESSVCALLLNGTLRCHGDESSGQLRVPERTKADKSDDSVEAGGAPARVDATLWLRFIELFPSKKLPLTFDEKQEVSLGDRVPPEFEPLLGADPNRYRTGVGIEMAHGVLALTLFDLETRSLRLFLFRDRRRLDSFEALSWDGTQKLNEVAKGARMLVTSPSTIEISMFEGRKDAPSSPGSDATCRIKQSSLVVTLRPGGTLDLKRSAMTLPERRVGAKECDDGFPF